MDIEQFKKDVAEGKEKDLWYFYKRTEEQKQSATEAIKELEIFFKQEFNLNIYLIYGTLLGAIREKNFILHDHDVDVAYLSKYHTKEMVIKEFNLLIKRLKSKDLLSKICSVGHLHVWSPNKKLKIDLWTSWIENDNLNIIPVIDGKLNKTSLIPLHTELFRNIEFNFPNQPLKILSYVYKNWQTQLTNGWLNTTWKKIL